MVASASRRSCSAEREDSIRTTATRASISMDEAPENWPRTAFWAVPRTSAVGVLMARSTSLRAWSYRGRAGPWTLAASRWPRAATSEGISVSLGGGVSFTWNAAGGPGGGGGAVCTATVEAAGGTAVVRGVWVGRAEIGGRPVSRTVMALKVTAFSGVARPALSRTAIRSWPGEVRRYLAGMVTWKTLSFPVEVQVGVISYPTAGSSPGTGAAASPPKMTLQAPVAKVP